MVGKLLSLKKYVKPFLASLIVAGIIFFLLWENQKNIQTTKTLAKKYATAQTDLAMLKKQDQYVINQDLKAKIKAAHDVFLQASKTYEGLSDFKIFDPQFALVLSQLADLNYASASVNLASLSAKLVVLSTLPAIPAVSAPSNNSAPDNGYSRQSVHTNSGDFVVDLAAADLGSAKVIIDTASDSTCANNCPVMSLGDYVARSGAFAGVNGTYFCPADYPSCAGKVNSFDLLVMNKNKVYFNSDNNVYSTNPAAIFGNGSARFVGQALGWGRDTSVDAVISNFPLLVSGHNNVVGGTSDAKMTGKSNRAFVANNGSKAYIGIVHNANVADSAAVLTALGMENAMNLDSGGSAAFWYGGYKVGPGRNLPNAVLFVQK